MWFYRYFYSAIIMFGYCDSGSGISKFNRWLYLTIRLLARDFCRVIVDEGTARVNYRVVIEIESE